MVALCWSTRRYSASAKANGGVWMAQDFETGRNTLGGKNPPQQERFYLLRR